MFYTKFMCMIKKEENKLEWILAEEVRFAGVKVFKKLFQQAKEDEKFIKISNGHAIKTLIGTNCFLFT